MRRRGAGRSRSAVDGAGAAAAAPRRDSRGFQEQPGRRVDPDGVVAVEGHGAPPGGRHDGDRRRPQEPEGERGVPGVGTRRYVAWGESALGPAGPIRLRHGPDPGLRLLRTEPPTGSADAGSSHYRGMASGRQRSLRPSPQRDRGRRPRSTPAPGCRTRTLVVVGSPPLGCEPTRGRGLDAGEEARRGSVWCRRGGEQGGQLLCSQGPP